jgi:hypothetical protein
MSRSVRAAASRSRIEAQGFRVGMDDERFHGKQLTQPSSAIRRVRALARADRLDLRSAGRPSSSQSTVSRHTI